MVKRYIKQWSDFSSSPIKPLFWMLIGPLLILLTLLVSLPTFYDPFLPCVSVLGLLLVWKWRMNGLSVTLLAFAAYFGSQFFFGTHGVALWKFGWGCSLALALTISFLAMEELKKYYQALKSEGDQSVAELKVSLHTVGEKAASEKRQVESEVERLQKELMASHDEMQALLQLVEASRVEAEKNQHQNETLSAESLKQHRQIEALKLQADESMEELESLQEQHTRLLEENRKRLKKLNQARTEYAQMQLLFDAAQNDFQKFRAVILSQRQQLQEKPAPKARAKTVKAPAKPKEHEDRSQQLILKTLEKDKTTIKKMYEQIQKDHTKLTKMLKEAKANEEEHVHTLENQVLDKQKKLEQTKSELVSLEREIFVVKKGMQQQGLEVS
ncbi:hypothetical protein [Simkania sp.]|uniref:hypothetical protein n=1 Tax=Simkania sp. TaxID=34094 RepID=UPI003B515721